ncbi:MAG: mycothiol system anti-sigma-R factor, partial [Calditrichaeota bacterium]
MTECNRIQDDIFDYVDGLLSIKNRKEVDRHIKGCNTCRDLYHR